MPELISPTPVPDCGEQLVLPDGALLCVRPIVPADSEPLAALFGRLSARSLQRRFLGTKQALTARELRYLVDIDGSSHDASVAIDPVSGVIVAESRFAAWRGRDRTADLAVTVADDLHGRRIGSAMAARAVDRARAAGFTLLTASTLWENVPARAMLSRLGFRPVGSSRGVLDFELVLDGAPPRWACSGRAA
jgi:RimJ/RimL family protein N-acetyltransferase